MSELRVEPLQRTLWEENDEYLSTDEAAKLLNVSIATIRNWLKSGLLKSGFTTRTIEKNSVLAFLSNEAGTTKLCARANKSKKATLQKTVKNSCDKNNDVTAYENSLPESIRNKEGIFYTPPSVVRDMIGVIPNIKDKLFLEPCCGCGNFVIELLEAGADPNKIYAFDVDEVAVRITQQRFYDKVGFFSDKILCGDFFELYKSLEIEFDYVITNPPWGKKMSIHEKKSYAKAFSTGASTDSSSLFLGLAMTLLKDHGILCFLLPDSFFNISTFEDIRKCVLRYRVKDWSIMGKFLKDYCFRLRLLR